MKTLSKKSYVENFAEKHVVESGVCLTP